MGQDDTSQAEDMSAAGKLNTGAAIKGVDIEGSHIALCQTAGHRSVISRECRSGRSDRDA